MPSRRWGTHDSDASPLEELAPWPPGCALDVADVRVIEANDGFVRSETVVRQLHLNQAGGVQGGVYAVLADATAGCATESFLGHAEYATTSFTTQLFGVVTLGDTIRVDATVVHPGRRTVVVNADLWRLRPDGSKSRVAQFSCQQLVL